jgi:lipooligosaccharide transport system ATP-binding protein
VHLPPRSQQRDRVLGDAVASDRPVRTVRASALTKRYGGFVAVDGIDFAVSEGECFGFLGPNGAGKTSTMKMIYGLATIDGGALEVLGEDVARNRRAVKARLGVVPQEENLDRGFTVAENLTIHANYFGIDSAQAERRAQELLRFVQLVERADDPIFALSGGMKRRLLIARALVNDPELVVLDEPTTGLDPQARIVVWGALSRLKRRGVTLVLTTHYMDEAERLCDRLVIMDQGRIVAEGRPSDLIAEHVGREVLELSVGERCPVEKLLESLDGRFSSYDRTDGQVLLYGDDAEALLSSIDHERYPTEQAIVRHATLEDVFLRLTGRSLRE